MNIFFVDPTSFSNLDAKSSTELLCNILRCEATRLQIPLQRILISSNTSAKDAGVDAKVEDVSGAASLLRKGSSYIQIKTGTTFKPWLKKHLLKELFGSVNAAPSKSKLAKEIARCLNKGGRYVLITFGHDLLPVQHPESVTTLTDIFKACGYRKPAVEVLGQGQIASLLLEYPSLSLDFRDLGGAQFQNHTSWSQNADMRASLVMGSAQKAFVADIRSAWRSQQFQHIRIVGEPGIGKTRLVLEAASEADLFPATLYIPHAEDFQSSLLFNELLKPDRQYTVHLVIDECEERERASIWNALKGKPHLKLITIDHGPETSSDASMQVYQCPPLPAEQISEILSEYLGKRNDLSNWAEWCEGSPRVAHAVGENLKRNPQDILKSPAIVPIWDRFVVGHKRIESRESEEHFIVLRHIALFQRFGFDQPVSEEGKFISRLITDADPTITWARFQSIVRYHQGRRILQGRHTLFIVPKALHVHLWLEFWNKHGLGFDFQAFVDRLPEGLKHWFFRLFIYAHASPVAQEVVKQILTLPSGPFASPQFLTSVVGTRLLNYLAEADPAATLYVLEQTFGSWSLDDLREWTTGRQDIVWALEKIAVWKDLFARAAAVLAGLALAENSNYSNNSRGTFVALFEIGIGWAATEAHPDSRFPILEAFVKSLKNEERNLGLELCRHWLSTRGGGRIVGAEYQGMRPTVEFWHPKTYGEIFDIWLRAWRFLRNEIRGWSGAERRLGEATLIDCGVELAPIGSLADEVMATLFELADNPEVDRAHFVKAVISQTRSNSSLPKKLLLKYKALDKKLTGSSFGDRFDRFVLFTSWEEDHRFVDGEVKEEKLPLRRVRKLAREVVANEPNFARHVEDFVSVEGHRLAQFGYEVGAQKGDGELDEILLAALKTVAQKATAEFLSGYLSFVREQAIDRWEAMILQVVKITELRAVAVSVILRTGMSTRLLRELVSLYRSNSIEPRVFSRIRFPPSERATQELLIKEVIDTLLEREDREASAVCIELVDDCLSQENEVTLAEGLIFRVIASFAALKSEENVMRDHYWDRVVTKYRKRYPAKDLDLFDLLLSCFDNLSSFRNYGAGRVADDIVRKHPRESWQAIGGAIERDQTRARYIVMWLRDSGFEGNRFLGAIRLVDPHDVVAWVSIAPDARISVIYQCLPSTLDAEAGGRLTQLFIERFGERDRVGSALISRFMHEGGWTGPRSKYLGRKRDDARKWLSAATSPIIQNWLAQYIAALSPQIESAQIEEERAF